MFERLRKVDLLSDRFVAPHDDFVVNHWYVVSFGRRPMSPLW